MNSVADGSVSSVVDEDVVGEHGGKAGLERVATEGEGAAVDDSVVLEDDVTGALTDHQMIGVVTENDTIAGAVDDDIVADDDSSDCLDTDRLRVDGDIPLYKRYK